MDNSGEKKSISEDTLKKIKSGRVAMRGKWHFIMGGLLWAIGGIVLLGLAAYLATFILFSLKVSGLWYVPNFGIKGIWLFIRELPWLLILLILVFVIGIEAIFKNKTSGYRKPLLYSAIALIILLSLLGAGFYRMSLHQRIAGHLQEMRFSALRPLYQRYSVVPERLDFGRVASIGDGFVAIISARDKQLRSFSIDNKTKLPLRAPVSPGDNIIIFSDKTGRGLRADGIKHMRAMKDIMEERVHMRYRAL